MKLTKPDLYFILVLILGIFLRILSLIGIEIEPDSYTYLEGTINIINFEYNALRPPGFPLTIVPFLLLTNNGFFSIKLASFTFSVLTIISSYFIFIKASLKLFGTNDERTNEKSKYIGLIVSFFLSFNLYFINNSGRGLREEFMALTVILIFYIIMVKNKCNLKENISLGSLISFLTLTHLTGGLFITLGILFFYFISKLKYFKFKTISFRTLLIIFLSFGITFVLWAFFCDIHFGDSLINWHQHNKTFQIKYGIDLSTIENVFKALINALIFGLPSEFIYLGALSSFVFIFLVISILIKNLVKKQFLFIFMIGGLNFAYLSIFMTIPRVLIYFFPLIFYLGAIPLGSTIIEFKERKNAFQKNMLYLLVIFFISYIIRGIDSMAIIFSLYQVYNYVPCFCNYNVIANQFYQELSIFRIILDIFFAIIIELSLLIYLIRSRYLNYFLLVDTSYNIQKDINKS